MNVEQPTKGGRRNPLSDLEQERIKRELAGLCWDCDAQVDPGQARCTFCSAERGAVFQ